MPTTALPLIVEVAALATLLALVIGVPCAWLLSRGRFAGRTLLETALLLPLVLPTTVLGYYLLVRLAQGGLAEPLGRWGLHPQFTWLGMVIAAWVGSVALVVRMARNGFERVEPNLEDAGRTLGRSEAGVLAAITLRLAAGSILAGGLLAFCRAALDVGITLFVVHHLAIGSIPSRFADSAPGVSEQLTLLLLAVAALGTLLFLAARLSPMRER